MGWVAQKLIIKLFPIHILFSSSFFVLAMSKRSGSDPKNPFGNAMTHLRFGRKRRSIQEQEQDECAKMNQFLDGIFHKDHFLNADEKSKSS